MKMLRCILIPALIALAVAAGPQLAQGWGGPHGTITQAALEVLPDWQKDMLGEELARLGRRYCLIPDLVYSDKALAPYR